MTDKIEEITRKIYNEGVIKAKEDAKIIISEARAKADEIVNEAKKQEAEIIRKAAEKADELRKKTETELQLSSRQFISKIKQQITEVITTKQVEKEVNSAYTDKDFIKKIILLTVQNWKPETTEDLHILLPEKIKNDFDAFLDVKVFETLDRKVEVGFDSQIDSGFRIGPANGSYIISFTEKDFTNYFKQYTKERTRKLLFDTSEDT